MSDDGAHAIVIIALVGSPFSPAYARACARGDADPLAHAAFHVAVYARDRSWWSLRERAIDPRRRERDALAIGRSSLAWRSGALTATIDERTTPLGRPVRGRVVLFPECGGGGALALDGAGAHRWWPIAPLARIEVDLEEPALRFRGHGYHDANVGETELGRAFETWCWSRTRVDDGAILAYDVRERTGAETRRAIRIDRGGTSRLDLTARAALPRTRWGLEREALADAGTAARVVRTLEDGPFYARALVESTIAGKRAVAMHEVLSGARLSQRWCRFFASFRMGSAAA